MKRIRYATAKKHTWISDIYEPVINKMKDMVDEHNRKTGQQEEFPAAFPLCKENVTVFFTFCTKHAWGKGTTHKGMRLLHECDLPVANIGCCAEDDMAPFESHEQAERAWCREP